jgi:hypothetical protein
MKMPKVTIKHYLDLVKAGTHPESFDPAVMWRAGEALGLRSPNELEAALTQALNARDERDGHPLFRVGDVNQWTPDLSAFVLAVDDNLLSVMLSDARPDRAAFWAVDRLPQVNAFVVRDPSTVQSGERSPSWWPLPGEAYRLVALDVDVVDLDDSDDSDDGSGFLYDSEPMRAERIRLILG